jgi:hypothetical protein
MNDFSKKTIQQMWELVYSLRKGHGLRELRGEDYSDCRASFIGGMMAARGMAASSSAQFTEQFLEELDEKIEAQMATDEALT